MNDLEICKRIAEIEGVRETHWDCDGRPFFSNPKHLAKGGKGYWDKYNPLTDDALCFELVKKYGVEIIPQWDRVSANNGIECTHEYAKNPNKAICLAIIEVHKGQSC